MLDLEIKKIDESLRLIRSEADYDRTVKMMNALPHLVEDDDEHPLSSLLELATDLISGFEHRHHFISFRFFFWPINTNNASGSYLAP